MGRLAMGDRRAAATAWLTVFQRILYVRKQLSGGTSGINER
jgi:hypothetical protein